MPVSNLQIRPTPRGRLAALADDSNELAMPIEIRNLMSYKVSPRLHNEDLAPAKERNWGPFSIFNVWTSDVHSLYGYFLAASLFLVAGGGLTFLFAIALGSVGVYFLMTMVGNAGQKTGVPYPVLARASFGIFGANFPALVRAVVATFWYGAQTSAAAGAIVAFLVRYDSMKAFNDSGKFLDHTPLEVICYVAVWAVQLLIISKGMETVRKFMDWAGPLVWIMMLVLAIGLSIQAGGFSLDVAMPAKDLAALAQSNTGFSVEPGSLGAILAVAATWITYFAALYLNFADFSRFSPSKASLRKGNLFGLPVNLILFSVVAALTTSAAYKVYHEVLLSPGDISAKWDNVFLALLACLTFATATLGINVVANFVSPSYDFANVAPSKIDFKKGGYIAAGIALVLYPFHPWDNAPSFVNAIGSTMGPLFGIMMVDYYLLRKQQVDVDALYTEDKTGPFYFQAGWNLKAVAAALFGSIFSSFMPIWGPAWYHDTLAPYGWFLGVIIAGLAYLAITGGKTPHAAK
jgi:NCS1 family nucleobase:cation symporter-1